MICTSRVGGGDATHTLYVSYQSAGGGGFDQPIAIATNVVAADVGSNSAIYQTEGVRIGDFNGDGYADIAMILGFQPGRTGSGVPSLFIYLNRPDLGMAQFQESTVNALSTSQSAINIAVGYINLDSILLPFLGVIGVIAGEAVLDRKERRRK